MDEGKLTEDGKLSLLSYEIPPSAMQGKPSYYLGSEPMKSGQSLNSQELQKAASSKFLSEDETTRLLFKYRQAQSRIGLLKGIIIGFFLGFLAISGLAIYLLDHR